LVRSFVAEDQYGSHHLMIAGIPQSLAKQRVGLGQ
jgi:hypothetical protein